MGLPRIGLSDQWCFLVSGLFRLTFSSLILHWFGWVEPRKLFICRDHYLYPDSECFSRREQTNWTVASNIIRFLEQSLPHLRKWHPESFSVVQVTNLGVFDSFLSLFTNDPSANSVDYNSIVCPKFSTSPCFNSHCVSFSLLSLVWLYAYLTGLSLALLFFYYSSSP